MGELVYEPTKGLGAMDRVLLRGASSRKSPNELSALTNGRVTPAAAGARVIEILESRDWLSQAYMKMLLVDDMMAVKDDLMEKALKFNHGAEVKPLISILTLLEKTLAADKLDLAKAMREIDKAHAQIMLAGISVALERSFLELEKRHPGIPKTELLEVFHAAMPDAIKMIESRTPKDE